MGTVVDSANKVADGSSSIGKKVKIIFVLGGPGSGNTQIEPEFILFFDCPEEEMEKRLLGRQQGRAYDNIETIRKRFKVYLESTLPVIEYYESKAKVRKIDAAKPVGEVFKFRNPISPLPMRR